MEIQAVLKETWKHTYQKGGHYSEQFGTGGDSAGLRYAVLTTTFKKNKK